MTITRKTEVEHILEALRNLGRFEHDRTLDEQMREKVGMHTGQTIAQVTEVVEKVERKRGQP